jgi:glycosyltransferase involved in cell wall biosynthesis
MLTVLLATRNRAELLRKVLQAYTGLHPPVGGWKVVVVDNGSTDHTGQVIASFADRLPLHGVTESRLGKNFALNAGLELAEGDLTVLTDDDAFPRSDWLTQLRLTADTDSAYSLFGGAIVARWEVPPPAWVQWLDLGPIFTITSDSLDDGPLPLDMFSVIQGPNMAIRSDIFRSGVRFDPMIGPKGASYPMGSETELVMRLGAQGYKARHVRNAIVEHLVRREQLDRHWILQRAVRWGRGRFRMAKNPKLWFGVPRHLLRDVPREMIHWTVARLSGRPDAALRARWQLGILRGIAQESWSMRQERG